jgi:hypothetical protein
MMFKNSVRSSKKTLLYYEAKLGQRCFRKYTPIILRITRNPQQKYTMWAKYKSYWLRQVVYIVAGRFKGLRMLHNTC